MGNKTTGNANGSNGRGWYIVVISALTGCVIAAGFPQFSMTVSGLSVASGITPDILLASDTVKSAALVIGMLFAGFLYNRLGATKVVVISLIATLAPQFLIPGVQHISLLMALKFIQGLPSGFLTPVFLTIIFKSIPPKNAGLSTAIFNSIFYAGAGIGGIIAGIVIASYDWVASFYVLGAIQMLFGVIWLLTVRDPQIQQDEEGLNRGPSNRSTMKSLITSPVIWLLSICFFAIQWVMQAVTIDWVVFGEWLGYNELTLSRIMTAATLGIVLACIISGRTSDFFCKSSLKKSLSRTGVLMAGYIMIIASVCLLIFSNLYDYNTFYAITFVVAFSAAWGLGTFYSIIPEIYNLRIVPVVTGITGGLGDIGMPVSPLVVGVVFGIKGLWDIGWASCAIVALIGFLAGIALLNIIKKQAPEPAKH